MSNTIDQSNIKLTFDNKEFEQNAKQSLSTISQLKSALNFSGSAKGLDEIQNTASRINFNGLSNSVDAVKLKFSALEVAAVSALSNIVNKAVDAGINFAKSFTIDPIIQGFNEYELKMGSIQTILANTTSRQATVSQDAVNEVNAAADAAAQRSEELNTQAIKNLQKSQKAQSRALQDAQEEQNEAFQKKSQERLKIFEEEAKKELEAYQKKADKETKAFEKQAEKEAKALSDKFDKQYDAYYKAAASDSAALKASFDTRKKTLEKSQKEETKVYQKSFQERQKALEKTQKEELKAIETNYDDQYEALKKSQENELKLLKKEHLERLDLYQEEYMQKLKVNDEDRYKEIKAIDDQIASINGLTKAEEEERKEAERNKKLTELQNAVNSTRTAGKRKEAEAELEEYIAQLQRERNEEERERQIEELEARKDAINEEYDLKEDAIKEEYEARKQQENDLYDTTVDNLKDQQSEELKYLKEVYDSQKEALKEQQELQKEALSEQIETEKEALQERQASEKEALDALYDQQEAALQKRQKAQLKSIQDNYKKELEALNKKQTKEKKNLEELQKSRLEKLTDQQEKEREALQERINKEQKALQKSQRAQSDALSERQSAEMEAMSTRHSQELQNIETEKNARIAALQQSAGMTKASSLEDVNKALAELNEYADKTIYNFADMTQNIGKFTTAGVDLDTSVDAIKGIANLAALSGSSSQQASTAMYQLSQAIASGTLRLQDWMSVENAGLGGTQFQDAIKETAKVHGVQIDEMIAKYGSFRLTLQEGWLSSEILLESLSKFTGDLTDEELRALGYSEDQIKHIQEVAKQAVASATDVRTLGQLMDTTAEAIGSGWSETFEIIFGDFEESKAMFTEISKFIGNLVDQQADARNQLLTGWAEQGGREKLIEAIKNLWSAITSVIKPIKDAFTDIFPPATAEGLVNATSKFAEFTKRLKLSKETSDKLRDTFKGLFSIISIGIEAFKGFLTAISPVAKVAGDIASGFLSLTGTAGKWITSLKDIIKQSQIYSKVGEGYKAVFSAIYDTIKNVISSIKELFSGFGDRASESIAFVSEKLTGLGVPVDKIKKIFSDFTKSIGKTFESAKKKVTEFAKILSDWGKEHIKMPDTTSIKAFTDTIIEKVKGLKPYVDKFKELVKSLFDTLKSNVPKIGSKLKDIATNFGDFGGEIKKALSGGLKSLIEWLKDVPDKVSVAFDGFKSFFESIKDWAGTNIKLPGLSSITDALKDFFDIFNSDQSVVHAEELIGGTNEVIDKIPTELKKSGINIKDALDGIIKTISGVFSGVDYDRVLTFIKNGTLASIGLSIANFINSLAKIAKSASKVVKNFKDVGTAVTDFIKEFHKIPKEIGNVISSVSGVFKSASGVLDEVKKNIKADRMKDTAKAILALAAAVLILAKAMEEVAEIPSDKINQAVGSVASMLGMLVGSMGLLQSVESKSKISASAILSFAGAVKVLGDVTETFSGMDWDSLKHGLEGVAGLIVGIDSMLLAGQKGGLTASQGGGLMLMAGSLEVLVDVVKRFAEMKFLEETAKGLGSMALALVEMGAAMAKMPANTEAAKAVFVMAIAMDALTPALKGMSSIELEGLGKALASMAGSLIVFGLAAKYLEPVAPAMIKLSIAIDLLGVGVAAIIGSIIALAVAIAKMSDQSAASIPAVIAAFGLLAGGILDKLIELTPKIGELIATIIKTVLENIAKYKATVIETMLTFATEVLKSLNNHAPELIELLIDLIIKVIDGIKPRIPELVEKAVDLFATLFSSIIETLKGLDEDTLVNSVEAIGVISTFLIALAGLEKLAVPAMVGLGKVSAVLGELSAVLAVFGGIKQIPGVTWLISEGGSFLQTVGSAIGNFIGGIVGGIVEGFASDLPDIASSLSSFMTNLSGFIEGAKTMDGLSLSWMKDLIDALISLSSTTSWITSGVGLRKVGLELSKFGGYLQTYASKVKGVTSEAVTGSSNAIKIITEAVDTIDKKGGLSGAIFGETDLAGFGEELNSFGPDIKKYAKTVKDVTGESVQGSANAIKILAEAADSIPSSASVLDKLNGEKDLSDFGDELKSFGPALVDYADKVSGITKKSVQGSVNAADMLIKLQKKLPENGGIFDIFTGGKQTLEEFGERLSAFGGSLVEYQTSVTELDTTKLNSVSVAVKKLVDIANDVDDIDTKKLKSFGKSLKTMGENGLDDLLGVFEDSENDVIEAVNKMIGFITKALKSAKKDLKEDAKSVGTSVATSLTKGITDKEKDATTSVGDFATAIHDVIITNLPSEDFTEAGENVADGIVTGIGSKGVDLNTAITTLASNIKTATTNAVKETDYKKIGKNILTYIKNGLNTRNKLSEILTAINNVAGGITSSFKKGISSNTFTALGGSIIGWIRNGINSPERKSAIYTTATSAANYIKNTFSNILTYTTFWTMGSNIIKGLVNGMNQNASAVTKAAGAVAKTAVDATRKGLDSHSPSKKFYDIGADTDLGFANGILDNADVVSDASSSLADSAMDPITGKMDDVYSSAADSQNSIEGATDSASSFDEVLKALSDTIQALTDDTAATSEEFRSLQEFIQQFLLDLAELREQVNGNKTEFENLGTAIQDVTTLLGSFSPMISSMTEQIQPLIEAVKDLAEIFDLLAQSISNATGNLSNMTGGYEDYYDTYTSGLDSGAYDYSDYGSGYSDAYSGVLDGLSDYDKNRDPDKVIIIGDETTDTSKTSSKKKGKGFVGSTTESNIGGIIDDLQSSLKGLTISYSQNQAQNIASIQDAKTAQELLSDKTDNIDAKVDQLLDAAQQEATQTIENNNVFNIQSTEPQAVAHEVGHILQRQYERGKAAWAK